MSLPADSGSLTDLHCFLADFTGFWTRFNTFVSNSFSSAVSSLQPPQTLCCSLGVKCLCLAKIFLRIVDCSLIAARCFLVLVFPILISGSFSNSIKSQRSMFLVCMLMCSCLKQATMMYTAGLKLSEGTTLWYMSFWFILSLFSFVCYEAIFYFSLTLHCSGEVIMNTHTHTVEIKCWNNKNSSRWFHSLGQKSVIYEFCLPACLLA